MPDVGPFGEIEGGSIAGKVDLLGNTFRNSEGSWDAWQPNDASTGSFIGACGSGMLADACSLWTGSGN
jgi:hypothetical protein